jgi:hypothetical protein
MEKQLVAITDRLTQDYGDRVGEDTVRLLVAENVRELLEARITQFVPVLVDKAVRERLGKGS